MRIGLIARSDRTGLGNQTRNLARMLHPEQVMLIDSSFFNGNAQHPEEYAQYSCTFIEGFPTEEQCKEWLKLVDVVITCEIFYNNRMVDIAAEMGVKTINQFNWEFADYLKNPYLTLPDVMVSPSKWMFNEARREWGNRVKYLPTPVFTDDFKEVADINFAREGRPRFLHVAGKQAVNDRNGTTDLLNALRFTRDDFELVIKMQKGDFGMINDSRVKLDMSSPENEVELYRDFDAMILPRRYAGQCLPMTEALCSALPVIMTDISPNNQILPPHWLVTADHINKFMARTWVDVYQASPVLLAERIRQFANKDLRSSKVEAYNIGYNNYSNKVLESQWRELLNEIA